MKKLNTLDIVSLVLLIIGGINWALVAMFKWDFIAAIFGEGSVLAIIIYILVGIAAIYSAVTLSELGKK